MQKITLDEQFRILLPMLDDETFRLLEENILEHGCRDPLVLWNGILIDGYNRYKIVTKHNLPFNTVNKDFDSREEVLIWIISNQISRRNLTPMQLSHFRGLHYMADKKIQGTNNRFVQKSKKAQNEPFYSGATASRLAEQYKVSRNTIKRDVKFAEAMSIIGEISPEAKRKILSGEVPINRSKLQTLPAAPIEKAKAIAAEIEMGTYTRRAARSPEQPETETNTTHEDASPPIPHELQELNSIIRDFAGNFDSMLRKMNAGGSMELKSVLRSYIDQLEEWYCQAMQ